MISGEKDVRSKKRKGDHLLEKVAKRVRDETQIKYEPRELGHIGLENSVHRDKIAGLEPIESIVKLEASSNATELLGFEGAHRKSRQAMGTYTFNKTNLNDYISEDISLGTTYLADVKPFGVSRACNDNASKSISPSFSHVASTESAKMLPKKLKRRVPAKAKSKTRGYFTEAQKKIMEVIYRKGNYKNPEVLELCRLITGLEIKQIKRWFVDRRRRRKRDEEIPKAESFLSSGGSNRTAAGGFKRFTSFQREMLLIAYNADALEQQKAKETMADVLGLTVKQVKRWIVDRRRRQPVAVGKRKTKPSKKSTMQSVNQVKSQDGNSQLTSFRATMPNPFDDPARIAPPSSIIRDGLDQSFACCGCGLDRQEDDVLICGNCCKKFHYVCLNNLCQGQLPAPGKVWQCPKCSPVGAGISLPTQVPNGRGQYYYKGQAVLAEDKNTGNSTPATIFMVGRDSILLHFNNWSNIYNQWIPSRTPKVTISDLKPDLPKTPVEITKKIINEHDKSADFFDASTSKQLLKMYWDTGIVMEDSYLPFVSATTGKTDKWLRKWRSDCKYRTQKKGQVIPVFNPNGGQTCGMKPLKLLNVLYEYGILKHRDRSYENPVSALTGLSIPKIRKWMSDKRYRESKKSKNGKGAKSSLAKTIPATSIKHSKANTTLTTLLPFQELVLRNAISIGKLNYSKPHTHQEMAIYCGITEGDVSNFLNKENNI